ncbi:22834_t:CDS:2, partial [Gigaspora rosea]
MIEMIWMNDIDNSKYMKEEGGTGTLKINSKLKEPKTISDEMPEVDL